jgi:hypothetical protein
MLRRALPLNFYTVTLFAILLGAFVLRIKSAFADSITADEVSALLRLQFSSFGAMIDGGVRPDGHPAFTQVLLWFWTKGFGDSTGVIRIPFVIMSTVAISRECCPSCNFLSCTVCWRDHMLQVSFSSRCCCTDFHAYRKISTEPRLHYSFWVLQELRTPIISPD